MAFQGQRLSPEDKADRDKEIVRLYNSLGVSQTVLGIRYRLSQETISKIVRGVKNGKVQMER